MNQFLAWLHVGPSGVRAPAETMLLKSKPHFVRCRELQSQVIVISFEPLVTADTEPAGTSFVLEKVLSWPNIAQVRG